MMSPILRGHFHRVGTKGRRGILMVELEPEETRRLEDALAALEVDGRPAHRWQSIPVAFVVGAAGETLARLQAETAAVPEPLPAAVDLSGPTVLEEIRDRVAEIAALLRACEARR